MFVSVDDERNEEEEQEGEDGALISTEEDYSLLVLNSNHIGDTKLVLKMLKVEHGWGPGLEVYASN